MAEEKLGIIVGGGPAPGINSVIGAATIRACLSNIPVVGLLDGFSWLMKGDTSHTRPLDIEAVSRIHFQGGSIYWTPQTGPMMVRVSGPGPTCRAGTAS